LLLTRVLSAAVLLPLLLAVVLRGSGWPFLLFVGVVAGLCGFEYARMFFPSLRDRAAAVALVLLAYLAGALLPAPAAFPAVLGVVVLALFHVFPGEAPHEAKLRDASLLALGAVYIGGFASCMPRLIALPGGPHWILLCFVVVAGNDTAAYFTGRLLGRRKLAPHLSPKKTVEGAVGGMAASLALGTAYAAHFLPGVPSWYAFLASGLAGAVGMGGDLFESLLKRAAGVKDSGTIIPGHGGMFDRSDSVIPALPVLYLLALLAPAAAGLFR
jgi:phosphatidate cytidylyltransferase